MNLFLQIILAAIAANVIATPVNNPQHPSPTPPQHLNGHHPVLLPVQPLPPTLNQQRDQLLRATLRQQHLAAARAHGSSAYTHVLVRDAARHAARHAAQGANAADSHILQDLAHEHDQRRLIAESDRDWHTRAAHLPPDRNITRILNSEMNGLENQRDAMNTLQFVRQHGANAAAALRQGHQIAASNHARSADAYSRASNTARHHAAQGANAADSRTLQDLANKLEHRRTTAENNQRWHTEAAEQLLPLDWNIERIRGSQSSGLHDLESAMNAIGHLEHGHRRQDLGTDPNNWQRTVEDIYRHDQVHRMAHQPNRV